MSDPQPPFSYRYSLANDFPGGQLNSDKLAIAILGSPIVTPLQEIDDNDDEVDIVFIDQLSAADKTILDGDQSSPAGGLIASTDSSPWPSQVPFIELGTLPKANFNTSGDQGIFLQSTKYVIRRITIANASGPIDPSIKGGIFTGRKGAGIIVVPPTSFDALTDPTVVLDLTLDPKVSSRMLTARQLFFNLNALQGKPVSADIHIFGDDYSGN